MKQTTPCPSDAELAAFIRGEVPPDREEFVSQHLDACPRCRQRWEQDPSESEFDANLRSAELAGREVQVDVSVPLKQLRAALPDYEIAQEIGRGGMGIVYEARHLVLNRMLALKVLPALLSAVRDGASIRFKREAELTARLKHNNIISVFDYGEVDGTCFYTMELVKGRSLKEVLEEVKTTGSIDSVLGHASPESSSAPPELANAVPTGSSSKKSSSMTFGTSASSDRLYFRRVAQWISGVAEALQYAHDQGVVHRDVKPSNLILAPDGRVMITDFGLAFAAESGDMTASRSVLGTARYMSPEQADPSRAAIDAKTDIYSLGATLYELLTFQPLFAGTDDREVIHRILNADPMPPRRIVPQLPWELETICLKALEKKRSARYATARELRDDLERWLLDLPITARRRSLPARLVKFVRRRKLATAAAAIIGVLSIGSAALYHEYRQRNEKYHASEAAGQERLRELSYLRARMLYDVGDYAGALTHAEELIRTYPTDSTIRNLHMATLLMLDRKQEAIESINELLQLDPNDKLGHLSLAVLYDASGNALLSRQHYERYRELGVDEAAEAYLTTIRETDDRQAVRQLTKAIEHNPDKALYWLQRSKRYFHLRQYEQSLHDAERVHRLLPNFVGGRVRRAWANYKLKQYREALNDCEAGLALDQEAMELWRLKGLVYYEMGKYEEAVTAATIGLRIRPDNTLLYLDRSKAQKALGRFDASAADATRAIERQPNDVHGYIDRGLIFSELGRWEKAITDFTRAIEIDPDITLSYGNRSVAYSKIGRYDRAVADMSKLIEHEPNNDLAYRSRAKFQKELGEYELAIADYSRALELVPEKVITFYRRALLYLQIGDYQRAIEDLDRYTTAHPEFGQAILLRGVCFELLGDDVRAMMDYGKLTDNDGPMGIYARVWKYILEKGGNRLAENQPLTSGFGTEAVAHFTELSQKANLTSTRRDSSLNFTWTENILRYFANDISASEFRALAATRDESAAAHYYIGMRAWIKKDPVQAVANLKACVALNREDLVESRVAHRRLKQIEGLDEQIRPSLTDSSK